MLVLRRDAGLREVIDADVLLRAGREVRAEVGLADVTVLRRAAAAGDETVEAVRFAAIGVPLDEMIEQMVVAGHPQLHVMFSEERPVQRSPRDRLRLAAGSRSFVA